MYVTTVLTTYEEFSSLTHPSHCLCHYGDVVIGSLRRRNIIPEDQQLGEMDFVGESAAAAGNQLTAFIWVALRP